MNTLDKRLACVASLVRPGRVLADIGTDHAYLPVHLVGAGVCPRAIASDIGEGPLAAARHTVQTAGMDDKIACRLGDGLSTISAGEVEDIAIAGMGGETIAAILSAADWVRDDRLRLVLQPMSRGEELRRWLLSNGFAILEERLVRDKHHLYPVMAAEYTGTLVEDELACYAGFFDPDEGRPYRQMMADHLLRRVAGLNRAGELTQAARLLDLETLLRKM